MRLCKLSVICFLSRYLFRQYTCDARANDATMIIARTDAIAVEGFEAALERAESYREAGAGLLFIQAPQNHDQ